MKQCAGIFGRLFGHDYKARHSDAFPDNMKGLKTGPFSGCATDYERMVAAYKDHIYHGDVCTRCGDTVNQTGASPLGEAP